MILAFNEEIINNKQITPNSYKCPNFVGFLNPSGKPIRFEDKYGYTGHGQAPSIQEQFRVYFPLKLKDNENVTALEAYVTSDEYINSQSESYISYLKQTIKELEYYKKRRKYALSFIQMEIDIYNFFVNCYSSKTFFESFGETKYCMCEHEFYERYYKVKFPDRDLYKCEHDFKLEYELYKDFILGDIFKEVMIMYLGYHSVERVPRTITTSETNIYETFYNYLLNGYTIYQLPRMNYNNKDKRYIKYINNEFFISEKEERLNEEIKSIKKLVPMSELSKYYR